MPKRPPLSQTHPELAAEAMFDPTAVTFGSGQKMRWKCTDHGHEWEATPNSRTGVNQTGCPVCSNNEVLAGFNDLQTTHPHLAREADFDPTTIKAGSNKKVSWKCVAHGHEWEAVIYSRTGGDKVGCPVCANRQVLAGFNDLQTKYPEVAAEAMFDPTTTLAGSHKKMPWKCAAHGHKWEVAVNSRTSNKKSGCPVCSGRQAQSGVNDLQTTHPDIAKEADFDPTTVVSGSNSKMPWKCAAHGHKWKAVVDNRTSKGSGCPVCSNQKLLAGFNDLQTTHPDLAKEADFDPTTVVSGSGKKMPWKCAAHGHKWKTSLVKRSGDKQGCPVCSNKEVLAGFNDLQTKYPEVAAEAMFDPTTTLAGSHKKMPWKCAAHGHEWQATVVGRTGRNKTGCPVCAETGFNPGDPAWLYLMRHPEWLLQQIGITNHPDRRLKKHANNGWEILDVRGPMDGYLTQDWEASILRWLSSHNIPRAASGTEESPHFDTPNSGEAWQQSDLNVTSMREIMDLVEADEQ